MSYKEKHQHWLNSKKIDNKTKKEMLQLSDYEIKELFSFDLKFGIGDAPFGNLSYKKPNTFCGAYDVLMS